MLGKIITFPTKAQKRAYKKKLLSLKTTIDILIVAAGVLLADLIVFILKKCL